MATLLAFELIDTLPVLLLPLGEVSRLAPGGALLTWREDKLLELLVLSGPICRCCVDDDDDDDVKEEEDDDDDDDGNDNGIADSFIILLEFLLFSSSSLSGGSGPCL